MIKAFGPKRSKSFLDNYRTLVMIVAAIIFTVSASAQDNDTTKFTYYRYLYGGQWDRVKAVKVLIVPKDTTYSKEGVAIINDVFYVGNGTYWIKAGGDNLVTKDELDSAIAAIDQSNLNFDDNFFYKSDGGTILHIDTSSDPAHLATQGMIAAASGVVTHDSTMSGSGTPGDSLRVKLSVVAGRAYVDQRFATIVSNGADSIGPVGVLHDSTLTGSGKVGDSLRANLAVLARKKYTDSLFGTLSPGLTDKFPAIDSANKSVLGAYSNAFPTSLVTKNYIDALSVSAGTTLTNWYNVLQYGAVANGTFTSGTDLSPAINTIIGIAPNNSVVFIPSGTYRALSTITWPTNKRLFLVCYGDIIFNSNNGFIIDGLQSPILWFYGTIFGTDQQGTTVNFGTQTNAGVYLRNSRNTEVHINKILGFKYAIKCGGYGDGNQYNRIWFNYLSRNSVGIQLCAEGPTTNPRWANDNTFYGGQIVADTGIVFQKDVNPGDFFNGNTFYNLGFEYAGNGPMKVAIKGDHMFNNIFHHFRIEPNGVTTKFLMTSDVNGTQYLDVFLQDSWMTNMGSSPYITGAIMGTYGDFLGNEAKGYYYSTANTYYNDRIRVYGTKRSPSAAGALSANIDMDWSNETSITVTGSTYTVQPGIKTVFVNNPAGTTTITLPAASSSPDAAITVKNINGTNNVIVSGPAPGETVSLAPKTGTTYYSNRSAWYDLSQKPSGGGGTSPFTTQSHGLSYPNRLTLGQTADPTAVMDLVGPNTPSVANTGVLKIHEQSLLNSPENGLIEANSNRLYYDIAGLRNEFLFTPTTGLPGQTLVRNNANDGFKYVYPATVFGNYHESTNADITVADGDYGVFVVGMTADRTITLPDPVTNPQRILILGMKRGGSNTLNLSRTIYNGGTVAWSGVLLNDNKIMIESDGVRWQLLMERL